MAGFATPLAAQSWVGLPPVNTVPDISNWQYRDLWLASEAQQQGRVSPPDELSARLNTLALSPPGSLASLGPGLSSGIPSAGIARSPYTAAPARRATLEINHNKAITKKLASAVHYQQVGGTAATFLSYMKLSSCLSVDQNHVHTGSF